jgi:hypothetical protein
MERCGLHTIDDVEGFVISALRRSGIKFEYYSRDDYEDMVGEGYAQLWDLAQRYDPARESDGQNRFHGYAYYLLPMKLRSAWHKMHEEHVLRKQTDGTRKYTFLPRPISFDALLEVDIHDNPKNFSHERNLRTPGNFVPISAPTRA